MNIYIFTLKNCPHCIELKKLLKKEHINFIEIDVEEYSEIWDSVIEKSGQDYLPTLLIQEGIKVNIYTPINDYKSLDELVEIIRLKLREQ